MLVDYGVITADQRENVIDKNKLRAQLPDFEKKLKRMRKNNLSRLKELGLMVVNMPDHYVVTGKPNDVYLAHFTPATLPCAAKRKHQKFYNSFSFYFF